MQDNNNIWDKFNEPNLEGEDWLEPKDSVFQNIEKEIFPQAESKKSRKKFGFIWLISGSLIAFTIGFVLMQYLANPTPNLEVISMSTDIEDSKLTDTQTNHAISSDSKSAVQEQIKKETNTISDEQSQNEIKNKSKLATSKSKINQVTPTKRQSKQISKTDLTYNSIPGQKNQNVNSSVASHSYNKKTSNTSNTIRDQNITSSLVITTEKPNKTVNQGPLFDIILNPLVSKNNELIKIEETAFAPIVMLQNDANEVDQNQSWLRLKYGITQWSFNLNDNYSSALNPADFYSSDASGFNLTFGYGKAINNLVDFNLDFIFNNVSLESGHNSQLTYPLAEEQDQSNSFTLLMATPLGFINSEVEIERVDENITDPQTDFGVGLINEHKITSLGLEPSLNFNLLKFKSFSFGPSAGVGLYYLNEISNQLAQVNSLHDAFESTEFKITDSQQNINRFLTTVNIGAQVEYAVCNKMKLGANANYKLPFQSSFNDQTGFSSTIAQSEIGLFIKYILK